MQFGHGNVLPQLDPTDGVPRSFEHHVGGTAAEVVDVEVEIEGGITEIDIVVARSRSAPSVNARAAQLAKYASSPVQVRLLVASTVTERATHVP